MPVDVARESAVIILFKLYGPIAARTALSWHSSNLNRYRGRLEHLQYVPSACSKLLVSLDEPDSGESDKHDRVRHPHGE